jgi:GNAT superfamily N-acetyltransferase
LKALRAGPLYSFQETSDVGHAAISITQDNADLLLDGLDEWRPDVALGLPMMATVADGRAVSICTSANASVSAHCAGVETLPAYRGRGFAAQTVVAWARAVQAIGAVPFYGTTFDNQASQGVARRLGLRLMGSEFSIECEVP